MGMRKSTRQELRKLREIARECLEGKTCYFCHKLLIDEKNYHAHGNGEGSPFDIDFGMFTIHHKNGNHHDNRKKNRKWSHSTCHRSYHLKLRHKERRRERRIEHRRLKRAA